VRAARLHLLVADTVVTHKVTFGWPFVLIQQSLLLKRKRVAEDKSQGIAIGLSRMDGACARFAETAP